MKFFFKRDISCADARFVIYDALCNEKYFVVSNGKSVEKLKLIDLEGNTLLKIKKLPLPVVYAFSISHKTENIKMILNPAKSAAGCYYYGISWHIRGNVFEKNFDIIDVDNTVVATHLKRWSGCADGYELNVYCREKELLCIASAVCINIVSIVDNPAIQAV